tara:strand:+ start:197 stop:370 length:174 start_codon:yes stop_codon:yes gene_type:complete
MNRHLTDEELHHASPIHLESDDEDYVSCGLCGWGFDTELELRQHHFEEHYELFRRKN